jgi:sugar (pentulose or hexulose) kinase
MKNIVLTIDLGTQSVRSVLIDEDGNLLHKTQHIYSKPYYSKHPGWAEQNPDIYWQAICDVTNRLKTEAGDLWNKIIAVTLTTIRDTSICVDKDGKPLRDFILWLDKRQAEMKKPLPPIHSFIYKIAGMMDTAELQRKVILNTNRVLHTLLPQFHTHCQCSSQVT